MVSEAPWTPTFGPDEKQIKLSGSQATPSRVLSEMRNATEIDLVAHGIINDSSDTSYLVLAEGPEGSKLGATDLWAILCSALNKTSGSAPDGAIVDGRGGHRPQRHGRVLAWVRTDRCDDWSGA